MTQYVLGFGFLVEPVLQVVGIQKVRPTWQAGQLNAPGGHVEEGEDIFHAVVREFKEETGVLAGRSWSLVGTIQWGNGDILSILSCASKDFEFVRTMTDETVSLVRVSEIPQLNPARYFELFVGMALAHEGIKNLSF